MAESGLKKKERLSGKKIFNKLFLSETSIVVFPYKIIWIEIPASDTHIQFGVSAPKRNFKKAVVRNVLKRRIKEAYRKNKYLLTDELKKQKVHIALLIIYISKEVLEYSEIEKKMIVSLRKVVDHYTKAI
jgi:ribonuclease P protein component